MSLSGNLNKVESSSNAKSFIDKLQKPVTQQIASPLSYYTEIPSTNRFIKPNNVSFSR